ncbi:MAG: histidinol-phosphatase HisJ [Bacteroidota bacterium]|nr:histidinol-phosphatase HisJ [Bacteroidota bacterium]
MWTNYHCHNNYCDGKGAIEEYILSAIKKNIQSIGFTSHSPLPFENKWSMKVEKLPEYINELKQLKEKYQSQIEIYTSLEIDFIDGVSGINSDLIKKYHLDYTLCSVHFLEKLSNGKYCEIEGSTVSFLNGLEEIWHNDKDAMLSSYFEAFKKMLDSSSPTIIGHLDKIKMHKYHNNEFVIDTTSQHYKNEAIKCLELIAASKSYLEVNTRAMYKKELEEPYPSISLIQIANELNIPLVLNSDSHHPTEIDNCFERTSELLMSAGIKKLKTLYKGNWIDAKLTRQGLQF